MPTTFGEALEYYESEEPRGEYVLVIEGADRDAAKRELQSSFESMSVEDHVAMYEAKGFDRKVAMKKAAEDRGVPKREIYSILYK